MNQRELDFYSGPSLGVALCHEPHALKGPRSTQLSREVRFLAQYAQVTIRRPSSAQTRGSLQRCPFHLAGFNGWALGNEGDGENGRKGIRGGGKGKIGEGWERKGGRKEEGKRREGGKFRSHSSFQTSEPYGACSPTCQCQGPRVTALLLLTRLTIKYG